ncbi:uncharacterized protein LOC123470994 [Daphnia magna]|uniref:uncharacterized protein LOC123470994 n=1 Tax=Daphnia magna TaxID=35525 RepID=UPI001E1BAAF8|nr:uncharacterized protein LOC123470994 [Daphnia magna]
MQISCILPWAMFCLAVASCFVLQPLPGSTNEDIQEVWQDEDEEEDCQPRIVSITDELVELGKHRETACPFRVENKTIEHENPFGNVTLDINEIICSGLCVAGNCGGPGRNCKQLMTTVKVSIHNSTTGETMGMFSTNVAIGCSCTPQDPGALGEDV